METPKTVLRVSDLHTAYGQSEVLHGISFEARANETVAIMGRNGMGKTTLFKSLIGMLPLKSGRIEVDGKDLSKEESHRRVAGGIAFVPQGRMIFPTLTVQENLETGLENAKVKEIPDDIYAMFPVLFDMRKRKGGNLSGGQQQQLAIGRALVTNPKVLLLDEPTEGIQPSIIKDIGRAISYLRNKGDMAIVLVEQYFDFAKELADDFIVMDRGAVVMAGDRASMNEKDVRQKISV